MPAHTLDDPAVVGDELVAFLERFLQSDDGAQAAAMSASLDAPPVLELRVTEPELTLCIDIGARTVTRGAADQPGAIAQIAARDLNNLLLDRLGPIEMSQLVEEERVHLEGPPPALAALLVLAGVIQPHYPASLAERGREDWLETPPPAVGEIWESEQPLPALYGKRRPWQRPKNLR